MATSITWRWRVVDIVVASIIAVASGVVFWAWNLGYEGPSAFFDAIVPGLSGLTAAPWLFAGILGGLVIRKPGAALYVELVAALVSMLIGAKWGVDTLLSGLIQGLGAELVFAAFLYRRFTLLVAVLAGALAALLEAFHQFVIWYSATTIEWKTLYGLSMVVSGAVIAGIASWAIARGLAATGALSRFAAGREQRADV